tara:strand:- start:1208 stop:1489 length:282 start_codon:yes stop_codon:yes gene_type:complete
MKNNNVCNYFCKIHGRVQGVGYRAWTKKTAKKYSLTGWVKNCKDLSVECEVSGNINEIKMFIKDCNEGPLFAFVKEIYTEKRPHKNFKEFKIN